MNSAPAKAAGNRLEENFVLTEEPRPDRQTYGTFLARITDITGLADSPGLLSLYPFPWAGRCRPCVCEHYLSTIQAIIKTYSADRFLLSTNEHTRVRGRAARFIARGTVMRMHAPLKRP